MEETLNSIAVVNTGLTTVMDQYKLSDSTPIRGRQSVAGPSATQPCMNPGPAVAFGSPSVSSLRDTGSEYSWNRGLREGAGSEGSAGGEADGTAGGAEG